jgi:hypothetical protein
MAVIEEDKSANNEQTRPQDEEPDTEEKVDRELEHPGITAGPPLAT